MKYNLLQIERITICKDSSSKIKRWISGLYSRFYEKVGSSSRKNSWYDRNGYRSIKAIEGFLHDPHNGQIARISPIF